MTFAYGGTTITLPAAEGKRTSLELERWQNCITCGNGSAKTYDHEVTEYWIELGFAVGYTKLVELRNFIRNTIKFKKNAFTFTPDSGFDAGSGKGVAITANLWQSNIPEDYDRPGVFECKLLLRAYSTGTGIPS